MDCYLGLLYVMEDYVVYGYITSMKVRIILTLALTDDIFRDAELIAVRFYVFIVQKIYLYVIFALLPLYLIFQMFRAFHSAYAQSLANPFLKLKASQEIIADHSSLLVHKGQKWRKFERLIDEVSRKAGTIFPETGR